MSTVAPINVNKLLGLDEEYNFLNPKFAPGTLDPAVTPAPAGKPPLSEALRNHYNATAEVPLGVGQLPPALPPTPETIQAGKPLLRRAGEATLGAAEAGAGYLNNAIRGHVKFLTDIGEGLTTSAAGLVTGGAGMATASSDILNTMSGRFAREGFTALVPGTTRADEEGMPVPAERSPTHFRDIFTRMEQRSHDYSLEPKSATGKAVAGAIALVPEAVKGVSDFVARRAEDLGMDPDKARVVSFGMELLTFYALDRGVRAAAPGIRSKVADLRTKVKNAKTDGDLLSPEVIDSATRLADSVNAHPEAGPALDAARARLIETLKQPARNLTETLRQPIENLTGTLRAGAEQPVSALADVLRRRAEQLPPEATAAVAAPPEPPALGISARARERIAARETVADPLAQARTVESPPTARTTVDDVISGRATPTEAAAVTSPMATPAPVVGVPPVAAAVPPTEISPARRLFERAIDENLKPRVHIAALSELKTLAREGLEKRQPTSLGLERLGFSPEEIATIEPRLKTVRASKPAEPAAALEEIVPAAVEPVLPQAESARVTELTAELDRIKTEAAAQQAEVKRVADEVARPDTQIAQTPEGELAYVKPDGTAISTVEQLPAHVELAQAAPGTEVTLPPAPGVVDTAPIIEKPKRARKVVKTKSDEQIAREFAAEETVAEMRGQREQRVNQRAAMEAELEGTGMPLSETGPVLERLFKAGVQPDAAAGALVPLGVPIEKARTIAGIAYDLHVRGQSIAESPVTATSAVTEIAARAGVETGTAPAAVTYHPVRSMTELGDRLGNAVTEAGTTAPERAAIQVRSTGGAKPDALFVDTAGLNTLTRLADIEKQMASGRMSKEVGDMSIANLRRQSELGGVPLSEAHTFNGQRLQREAVLTADMLGLDLYVKKGKNYELMPKDAVKAEAKLSRGDVTTPSGVTRDEAAALADFKSRPVGPEQLKEILESSEKGIDISDRLPADLAPHYKTLLESERQGINTSERRNFIDILKDVNTILGESGAVGPRGPGMFSRDRRMAAQRLEADARRTGNRFIDMFRNKLDPAEIPMFERYLERISNPEPPRGVGPGRMNLDPDAIARGDQIVKWRKTNLEGEEVPKGPPLWESDVIPIYDAANPGRSTFRFLENPIYQMEKMGLKDPLYTAVRTAFHEYGLSLKAFRKDLKDMTSYFGPTSRERIGAYGYSKSVEGMRLLEKAGVEVPTLNPAEMRMYNEARSIYENFYNQTNEARIAGGQEPLMKVDNYFTFARSYSVMEKLGVLPDMLRHPPADINAAFLNHSATPFPHERIRSGSTYAAEFDAFRLMDRYASSALKQIHVSPVVAKLNELIETKLPSPTETHLPWELRHQNWSLKEENPNAYNILHNWKEFIATGQSPQFQMPKKVENLVTAVGGNLAYSLLSANLRSAAVQISTIRNTFQSIGYIPTLEGITRSIADIATGGERWQRGMDKSEYLSSRRLQDAFTGMEFSLTGFKPREFVGAVARGRFTELQGAVAGAGMKFLEVMDMVSANVSWNAAFDHYLKKIGKDERGAIRYADDLVVKTQGSTMPGDLAAIQRSVAGKALTQFQTFLISDWNFLTKEVLGIGDKSMSKTQMAINAAKFVGTTSAFNVLFEDVLNIQSPFPTPVKDIKRAIAGSDDDPLLTAWRLAGGAIEVMPIIGASRYQKSIAGPAVNTVYDFTRALAGAPLAPSPYEPLAKMAGVPATQQVSKFVRARKRGESVYNSLMGWYSEEEATGSSERSGRSSGGRGR